MKNYFFIVFIWVMTLTSVYAQSLYVPGGTVGTSANNDRLGFKTSNPNATFHLNAVSGETNLLRLQLGGSTKFLVNKNGGLSLGRVHTLNPNGEVLNLYNSIQNSAYARIEAKASNAYWIANGKEHGSGLIMENNGNAKAFVYWSKSGGQGLALDETSAAGDEIFIKNGNVAIGSHNVSHKLTVNGTIRAKEIIVNTNWADFVFEDDYRLIPLSEVETFIRKNKHLPGMPSADQVKRKGVGLAEANTLLLQKVEELTLHVINLEKKVNALQAENVALKNN